RPGVSTKETSERLESAGLRAGRAVTLAVVVTRTGGVVPSLAAAGALARVLALAAILRCGGGGGSCTGRGGRRGRRIVTTARHHADEHSRHRRRCQNLADLHLRSS